MRILHVDPERAFSGGEVQVFLLMEGLRARGHHNVLACVPGGEPERVARDRGFDRVALPMRNDFDLRAVARLTRALRDGRIDLAHLHTGRANWLGGLAAARAGVPAVTTRRMDRRVRPGWRTRVLYRRLVRAAAAISPAVQRRLVEGGVGPERTRLIWSAIDPARVAPRRTRAEVRGELGAGDADRVVLAAGALVPRKGFDVLVEALARLERGRLWIAGGGDEARADLAARIDRLGLGERARLLGARDDVPDLLAAADVFAMPSRAEGLGIAALEAMAAGLPVVASAVGGLADVVLDGETGRLVPPDDVAALAGALAELLEDPARAALLGTAGRARVAAQFTSERMVDAYEALYREILAEAAA